MLQPGPPSGSSTMQISRLYKIPSSQPGTYDVAWGLWLRVGSAEQSIHGVLSPNALQVATSSQPVDLVISAINWVPANPKTSGQPVTFNVTVQNNGLASSGAFKVGLTVGGASLSKQPVAGLSSGASTTVSFSWSATCGSSNVSATADVDSQVSESNESNNSSSNTINGNCPPPPTPGILSVTPSENFSVSGNQGGPFSPVSKMYTLTNTGGSSINWSASKAQSWVSLSKTSGTLAPNGTDTVTVSINNGANSLTSSTSAYSDSVSFSNTTNGNGNTAWSVSLSVSPLAPQTADLAVSITASPNPVTVGSDLTYSITITNQGSVDATNVRVTDTLPNDVSLESFSASQGNCEKDASHVICNLGTLTKNSSRTIAIVVQPTKVLSAMTNTAAVVGNETDPDLRDNTATRTVTVSGVPVIFIPGIMGSVLVKHNQPPTPNEIIWPDKLCSIPRLADDLVIRFLRDLRLDNQGVTAEDIIRTKPTGYLSCNGEDVYDSFIRFLQYTVGYQEDLNLFVLPYDWRDDLRKAAQKLADKVARTGTDKVDIVAHSMGGLVARYCMNKLSTCSTKVRKIILMGTPNYGSVDSYVMLHPELGKCLNPVSKGRELYCIDRLAKTFQRTTMTFPGVYQLLPTRKFFSMYRAIFDDRYPSDTAGAGLLNGGGNPSAALLTTYSENEDSKLENQDLILDALRFHGEGPMGMGEILRFSGETYLIVGSGVPTALIVQKSLIRKIDISETDWDAFAIDGDGTVPLHSADGLEVENGTRCVSYIEEEHGNLTKNGKVQDNVLTILQGNNPDQICKKIAPTPAQPFIDKDGFLKKVSSTPLGVKVDKIHVKSPVYLRVLDSQGNLIGPNENKDILAVPPRTNYLILGNSTTAFLPSEETYKVDLEAFAGGAFGFEITQFQNETITKTIDYGVINISAQSKATLDYNPSSPTPPSIKLDHDGNGTVDLIIPPPQLPHISGDVNGDGVINAADLDRLKEAISGAKPLTAEEFTRADVTYKCGSGASKELAKDLKILTSFVQKPRTLRDFCWPASQINQPFQMTKEGISGDVTGDGVVTQADLVRLDAAIAGTNGLDAAEFSRADIATLCGVNTPKELKKDRKAITTFVQKGRPVKDSCHSGLFIGQPFAANPDTFEWFTELALNDSNADADAVRVQMFNLSGMLKYDSTYLELTALVINFGGDIENKLANGVYLAVITSRREDGTIAKSTVKKIVIKR